MIEVHGFKDNQNNFIIKELAICNETFQCQVLFKSPFKFDLLSEKMQRTARWLTRHLHGIKWDDGDMQYSESFIRSLCEPFAALYTKGGEKVLFLSQFHPNVREITSLCVNNDLQRDSSAGCLLPQHRNNRSVKCALRSAQGLVRSI